MNGRVTGPVFSSKPRHDPPVPGCRTPETEVIRPFVRGASTFGADSVLELRGGAALGPEALSSTFPLDWQAEALGFVRGACSELRSSGTRWLSMPPCALLGEEGSGRTHFVRQLAHHSGLPYHVWNLSREIRDAAASPRAIAFPPEPLAAMLASRCANPIVAVVGTDEAHASVIEDLAGMIDARTNRRRVEHAIGATVDYSNVTWIIIPTSAAMLPAPLEPLLRPVRLFRPSRTDLRLAALGAVDEAVFNLGLDRTPEGIRLDEIIGRAHPLPFFRVIYERAHDQVQAYAHNTATTHE